MFLKKREENFKCMLQSIGIERMKAALISTYKTLV